MKQQLKFVYALVFVLSLGLSAAFAQNTKRATQNTAQQGTSATATTSMKKGTKSKMMSKKRKSSHHHHRKIARRGNNVAGQKKAKENKVKSERP
jgi:hypothetical protein